MKKLSILFAALLLVLGIAAQAFAAIYAPKVFSENNNLTMLDSTGALLGGTNDVYFNWDGTLKTAVVVSGQVSNAVLASTCPFSGTTWSAHDAAIYGPGTYTVFTNCAAGRPGCGSGTSISFTVNPGELGLHLLLSYGTSTNIDVVNILAPNQTFGPSPMYTGACGSNPANKVWTWMSRDTGTGINGVPIMDGGTLGAAYVNFSVMKSAVDTTNNNFTMVAPDGTLTGGTNDVRVTWDGVMKTAVAVSGQKPNASISSTCPFNGFTWLAHDVAVYGPGTYTVNPCCPAGSPGCATTCLTYDGQLPIEPITFTVGAGEMGGHMLLNWSINANIDAVDVWAPNTLFGPSPLFDGTMPGGCGSNAATTSWSWMSKDWGSCSTLYTDLITGNEACAGVADGVPDGLNGAPMVDSPFNGQNTNFNWMGACTTDFDCNDNNVCTTDLCIAGVCQRIANTLSCNDNVFCNGTDTCSGGTCSVHSGNPCVAPLVCNETTDSCVDLCADAATRCNDNNVCTDDGCNLATGVCTHTFNALPCDDGLFCNGTDTCSGGTCSVHSGNPCNPATEYCNETTDHCDPNFVAVDTTNNNLTVIAPDGTRTGGTNDVHFTWDVTMKTSVAVSGQVSNATISSICPFSGSTWKAHDVAIYGPGTYTVNPCCPAGSPGCSATCLTSDGQLNISPITFTVGPGELGGHILVDWSINHNIDVVDIWAPNQVFAPSPLFDGTSPGGCSTNPATKIWSWMSKDWGSCSTLYTDLNTGGEACAGIADGVLDNLNGAPMVDGPLNDHNVNFNWMGGTCVCPLPPPCQAAIDCDPTTGVCAYTNLADGTACNDGNACTTNDVCTNGTCGGIHVVCTALDQCHVAGVCNTATGACSNPIAANGTSCNDGNACTVGDVCNNGTCSGISVVCTALDQCHVAGVCNSTTGICSNPPAPNGTTCSDGNACTVNDVCSNGVCTGTPKNCDDNNACTTDSCDPATGGCVYTPVSATSGFITTVAGNGSYNYSGDSGPATSAGLAWPYGVAVDSTGNIYIAEYNDSRIRKVNTSGTITTVAGNGTSGYSGDNGPAASARLSLPTGVAVDSSGNIYIADMSNERIRKIDISGTITTVAGNGTSGYSGDNGPATSASLFYPIGVAVDSSGNVYIADTTNHRIRKVNTSGIITTVAGNGISGYSGDNGLATAAAINGPTGVVVDSAGNIYIADPYNHCIRKVNTSGIITTVAGNGAEGYSGDNGPAISAKLDWPYGVSMDPLGNLYIADRNNFRIRKVDTSGIITTVAGNGTKGYSGDNGSAISASLSYAYGVAVDSSGGIYIADSDNYRIRKVTMSISPCLCQPDGTPCNDGNACTTGDVCNNGTCAGTPVVCTALDQCHVAGVCNTATGTCSNPQAPNGTACTDGNACTVGDSCQGGVCTAGTPLNCNDNNACTTDYCDPATGCNHKPVVCPLMPISVCETQICDPARGCLIIPVPDGTSCDDGIFCDGADTCSGGTCVHTGNPCPTGTTCNESTDHCDAVDCTVQPAGTACNDNNPCTTNDVCVKSGNKMVCKGTNAANGAACDDGNLCTVNDSCQSGVCKGTARNCNDNNACTIDTCNSATGCVNTPINCDDGNVCTIDSCNPADGQCQHKPIKNCKP